jgi:hypothetical protein
MSDNLEILIIQNLRSLIPRPEVLLFYQKRSSSMKQAHLRDMFKKTPRASVHQLLWYLLTPCLLTPSTYSAMKTTENTDCEPDGSKPAAEGDIQLEYFSD